MGCQPIHITLHEPHRCTIPLRIVNHNSYTNYIVDGFSIPYIILPGEKMRFKVNESPLGKFTWEPCNEYEEEWDTTCKYSLCHKELMEKVGCLDK